MEEGGGGGATDGGDGADHGGAGASTVASEPLAGESEERVRGAGAERLISSAGKVKGEVEGEVEGEGADARVGARNSDAATGATASEALGRKDDGQRDQRPEHEHGNGHQGSGPANEMLDCTAAGVSAGEAGPSEGRGPSSPAPPPATAAAAAATSNTAPPPAGDSPASLADAPPAARLPSTAVRQCACWTLALCAEWMVQVFSVEGHASCCVHVWGFTVVWLVKPILCPSWLPPISTGLPPVPPMQCCSSLSQGLLPSRLSPTPSMHRIRSIRESSVSL